MIETVETLIDPVNEAGPFAGFHHRLKQFESVAEMEDVLYACRGSLKLFCKTFLPDRFDKEFSSIIHDPIFEILDDDLIQLFAIAAPRGVGKTSLVNLAFPLHRILFKKSNYIVPVSSTSDVAVEHSENLKNEMLSNENILCIPDWANLKAEDRSDPFGAKEWVTSTRIKIKPRGAGQQVRGRLYRGKRPDLFLVDDIEDDEGVKSEDRRDKLNEWFFSALYNSVDRSVPNWRIGVIGTILHPDSFLSNLLKNKRWETVKLRLCSPKYVSFWPQHMSNKDCEELADEYRSKGNLDIFHREFLNEVIPAEEQRFRSEYFQSYNDEHTEESLNNDPNNVGVVMWDPARTYHEKSNKTAICGVTINTMTNDIFVRDMINERMMPADVLPQVFEMAKKINALILAPEVTGLHEYLLQPLRDYMGLHETFYPIVEVKPRQMKTGPLRSAGLHEYYKNRHVYHNRAVCSSLEIRLMQWPRPDEWDEIDSLSSILFVRDTGKQYFTPASLSPEEIHATAQSLQGMKDGKSIRMPERVGW